MLRAYMLRSCLLWLWIAPAAYAQPTRIIWMDDLNIRSFSEGIASVSVNANAGGEPMMMGGARFNRGVGLQSLSVLSFLLDGGANTFRASVGADDKANANARFTFYVIGDRKVLFEAREMRQGDAPQKVSVDLTGIKRLGLLVKVTGALVFNAYFDLAEAQFVMIGDRAPQPMPNADEKHLLTPATPQTPRINSPSVFGARPGNPFLLAVAATGQRPMYLAAEGLPEGLSIDSATGIISGKVGKQDNYTVTLKARNAFGETAKKLRVAIGDTIALTPPMGWNGWNSWAKEIDREKVMNSAQAMVRMGLRDHGWTYVNIDDAWQGQRGGQWNAIQPNAKFPDFKQMVDQIHALGLKMGVYSTPWISSYAGYVGGSSDFENGAYPESIRNNKRAFRRIGKYRFEVDDAQQMADWGIDYLKYDWRLQVSSAERMSDALRKSGRDIVYSLSNAASFADAKDWARVSNLWRTGSDIRDSWLSLYHSVFTIDKWGPYGGPGHWNDPDMLILGHVTTGSGLHPTRLTPDEQYAHVSLFCLLSSPLLIGCPIDQMDAFTLNLLTNDEVIEIDQDPQGRSARLLADENGVQVWLKPLEDGSYAVGLFNTDNYGKTPQTFFRWGDEGSKNYRLEFEKLSLTGKWRLRDVWKQRDLGVFDHAFDTDIRHHGVVLLRMFSNPTTQRAPGDSTLGPDR